MKATRLIMAVLMVCTLLGVAPAMADNNYTMSLESTSDGAVAKDKFLQGDALVLNIVATKVSGDDKIAGAAFTLEYPDAILQGPTTTDGIPNNNGDTSIITIFPFSITKDQVTTDTHRQNQVISGTTGLIYFAGAGIGANGASPAQGDEEALFTVHFKVKNDAPLDLFDIVLRPTKLYNPDAGYGDASDANQTPEAVTALVGAVEPSGRKDASADFPVLLSTFAPVTASLAMTDGDSIDDDWERAQFGDLDTANDTTDFDNDGYLDKYEQPSANNTNPKVQDPAWTLDNYAPATDDRGPYQWVYGNPSDPRAPVGEAFTVDVMYNVTDGDATLGDFTLVMHYDSTKLTLDSWDNVVPANDGVISATDTTTPTDATLTITWDANDASEDWPNRFLPATLFSATFTASGMNEGDTSDITFTAVPDTDYAFHSTPITYTVGPTFVLDVDGNGSAVVGTDGVMLYRYLQYQGIGGVQPGWTLNRFDSNGTRGSEAAVEAYLDSALAAGLLDADGNGASVVGTDGVMLYRYLQYQGIGGVQPGWTLNRFDSNGTRGSEAAVETYFDGLMP